ncbi:hypothetical protein SDC9_93021 [bioreactor metagenome]|uniref:Uncharacterized protein n=1 Tax=bioreactor metagenome TaxID=1076179 RepID=A0A645A628_9ZZZZ
MDDIGPTGRDRGVERGQPHRGRGGGQGEQEEDAPTEETTECRRQDRQPEVGGDQDWH